MRMFSCGVFGELLYRIETNQIQSYLAQKAHMKIGSRLLPRTLNFQWQPCESNVSFKKKLCHLFGFHARSIYPAISPTESPHPLAALLAPHSLCGPVALRPARARSTVPLPCAPHPCPVARSRGRAHRSCPVAVGRDVPIAPPRRIARGGSPPRCAAWQVAHAESFACRGSVRGTVRGRAAHPARWSAAGPPGSRRHLPTRITHAITHDHGTMRRDGRPWGLPTRALPPLRTARATPPNSAHPRRTLPRTARALPRPLPARCLPERIPVW